MAKKVVKPEDLAMEALSRAVADPTPLKLHGTKANPGIFLSSTQKHKDAAKLCLQRGWLVGTGEMVGKGKSAKETYRITPAGVQFVLENGEIPTLLNDLLLANDGQQDTLRQLQSTVGRVTDALAAQNELLKSMREKVTPPKLPDLSAQPAPVTATAANGRWLQSAVDYVANYRKQHAHRSCPFSELYEKVAQPAGVSVGQFHDGLRQLSKERKISLRPWTGAMSDLQDDHLALVLAKETKFYADPVN